jgi:PAS domain-containing protein
VGALEVIGPVGRWSATAAVASPSSDVPYLYLAVVAIAGLLAVAIGGLFVLRVQVRARTERLESANRALAESELKYRELVELANSIILRWSRDGRITFLNEFGLRFFGFAADEIVGRHGA